MTVKKFTQYVVEGPKGRVVLSKEIELFTGSNLAKPWTALHEALGAWTVEITEDSDAEREAKYVSALTGISISHLTTFFKTL